MAGPRAEAIGRGRLAALLLILPLAALLAFRAEASRTGVWESNPPASLTVTRADAAGLLASLATTAATDIEAEEPHRFDLGDITLVESAREHKDHFGLGSLTLVDLNLLRGPPPSYPETRVRGFELLPPFRIGAAPSLSLWPRQACGSSCREVVSDSPEDPWGLETGGAFTADNPENRELKRRYMAGETPRTPQELAFERAVVGGAAGATAGAAGWLGAAGAWASVSAQWSIGSHWMGAKWFVLANAARGNLDRTVEFFVDLVTPDPRGAGMAHPERGAWVPGGVRRRSARGATGAAKTGETLDTAIGREVHSATEAERTADDGWDVVNRIMRDEGGAPIRVARRVDLETGAAVASKGTQTVRPDGVSFGYEVVLDDKPLTRSLVKDRQEIIRNIEAYRIRTGKLPRRVAIQRYDPVTKEPVYSEIFGPEHFLPRPKR